MTAFLRENAATIVIALTVLAALAAAARSIIRRRGKGCGSCEGCPRAGECGKDKEN